MNGQLNVAVAALSLAGLLLAGCLPPSGGGSGGCEPGETRSCPCPGGERGLQTCADGDRFGVCACNSATADGAIQGGDAGRGNGDGAVVPPTPARPGDGGASIDAGFLNDVGLPSRRDGGGFSDFGVRDALPAIDAASSRDAAVPPEDASPQPRDASIQPQDAAPPILDAAADVGGRFDAAPSPDVLDGPPCVGEPDCQRVCDWVGACFTDPRTCDFPNERLGRDFQNACIANCGDLLLDAICRLETCADLAAPMLAGDQWREACVDDGRAPDMGVPDPDPEPDPDAGAPPLPDADHPGNRGPDCGGGCDALCEWTAGCFSFDPDLCPTGSPAAAGRAAQTCPALCRNPGLQQLVCQFQSCRELSQVAGLLATNVEEACFEGDPPEPEPDPDPDPECRQGLRLGGVCWTHLSPPCHRGSAMAYCREVNARLPTVDELRRYFDAGLEPGPDYHTIAAQARAEDECDEVSNVIVPTWRRGDSYDVWQCGDNPGFCNRAVICVR